MDISVEYMGLKLANPVVVSSSDLTNSVPKIKQIAKNGAGAVVLKSLFEEQIVADKGKLIEQDDLYFWYPEALEYMDTISKEQGVKEYLKMITDLKNSCSIPIIASINCISENEWPSFASELEKAGADALELNIAIFPFGKDNKAEFIENQYINILKKVLENTKLPVAVKIGPHFTNIHQLAYRLCRTGSRSIVLFNRFFTPNISLQNLRVTNENIFSTPEELGTSLRWIGLLYNQVSCDLAASTGIHTVNEVVKQLLMGATVTQVCSTLYLNGIHYLSKIIDDLKFWMEDHNFERIAEFRGLVANDKTNRASFERLQFMKKTTGDFTKPPEK